jgi:hypothetical protein
MATLNWVEPRQDPTALQKWEEMWAEEGTKSLPGPGNRIPVDVLQVCAEGNDAHNVSGGIAARVRIGNPDVSQGRLRMDATERLDQSSADVQVA